MSRPASIIVTRKDVTLQELKKLYKKTRDLAKGLKILAIIDMIIYENAEEVAQFLQLEADTVRRWVQEYNAEGVTVFEKKSASGPTAN